MKNFMDDQDFLLSTKTGEELFHNFAEGMPIVDYHCHISPKEIWDDKRFENITEVWLGGDHYKWRLMRANGVDERFITGDAPAREKFQKWAETLGRCVGNPVFEWSHLELKRYFGYEGVLNGKTAQEVWDLANAKLAEASFTCRNLIKQSNVRMICTTDDPADSFEWHKKIAADDSFDVQVVPAMRPDAALRIERGQEFADYCKHLSEVAGVEISDFEGMKAAISKRYEVAHELGCRASDHALDYVMYAPATADEIEAIGGSQLAGEIGAISAEHLIVCPPEGIASMAKGGVIACLLPATSFNLGAVFAPARDMVKAGVPVAMATDFNPGSCPCLNMQFVINLGCLKYKLTPEEVLTAVTLNGAAAIDLADKVGSVEEGKLGDLVIWDAPDLDYICYRVGSNLAKTVIKRGEIV
jgi:hypothetical protein